MSYAVKVGRYNAVARSGAMGDPGLFGFLGKAISGVAKVASFIPGPIGMIGGAVSGATGSRSTVVSQRPSPGTVMTAGSIPSMSGLPGVGSPPLIPSSVFPISIGGSRGINIGTAPTLTGPGGQPFGAGGLPYAPVGPTTGALVGTGAHTPCARGYHYNRTGYFTKKYGYIEPGSVCVRNRRRNPLNPRALSRAMARLASAKKATRCLARYSIRERKACGCGSR